MLGGGAMIFASVGSMLPFDRLVRALDQWAEAHPDMPVFIQIGGGDYLPSHARWARMLSHDDYRHRLEGCRLFVAHVGMGSILQGLEARRPMLLMPRLPELGEHTTDHQRHTAERFRATSGLDIVDDSTALAQALDAALAIPPSAPEAIAPYASPTLIAAVSAFLETGRR